LKALEFISVQKSFEDKSVLRGANFSIQDGEFVTILGANGSGKTTVLNLIAGLLNTDSGVIVRSHSASTSYIRQNYADTLLPWKKNIQNLTLPLQIANTPKEQRTAIANQFIDRFEMDFNFQKYPYQLSGGQQQQLALLRGIISNPEVLLLDEPFGALDYAIRRRISNQILKYWQERQCTVVMVTHDIDEAILLSDRILLLVDGKIDENSNYTIEFERPRNIELIAAPRFGLLKANIIKTLGYD